MNRRIVRVVPPDFYCNGKLADGGTDVGNYLAGCRQAMVDGFRDKGDIDS